MNNSEEEKFLAKILVLSQQGVWTKWGIMTQNTIKWSEIWRNDTGINFLIRTLYDIRPSTVNLHL